jgi:hypothetical protein
MGLELKPQFLLVQAGLMGEQRQIDISQLSMAWEQECNGRPVTVMRAINEAEYRFVGEIDSLFSAFKRAGIETIDARHPETHQPVLIVLSHAMPTAAVPDAIVKPKGQTESFEVLNRNGAPMTTANFLRLKGYIVTDMPVHEAA